MQLPKWLNQLFGNVLPKDPSTIERGTFGENLALNHLNKKLNYKILEKNWQSKNTKLRGEIDIIAKDNNTLVFIEVRSRDSSASVPGYYTVNKKKKTILEKSCKTYLREQKITYKHFRFDIIEVRLCNNEENSINHYTNVPLFSKNFH